MTARFTLRRHCLFKPGDSRARERSTLMASTALYLIAMSQLGDDRLNLLGQLRTDRASLSAHLCRPSTSQHQIPAAAGGLKLHSLGPRFRSTRYIRHPAPACC